jgi:FkbH-like protein
MERHELAARPHPSPAASDLRSRIESAMESGEVRQAAQWLGDYWRRERTPAAAHFAVRHYETLAPHLGLTKCRLAILRSFTVEPLEPPLRAAAFSAGIDLDVRISGFNTYMQEILEPAGPLQAFHPDVAILALHTADIAPELWHDASGLTPEQRGAAIERVCAHFASCIEGFRRGHSGSLIVHNLQQPVTPSAGLLDAQSPDGQRRALEEINHRLRQLAGQHRGVYILDCDALVARHGREPWTDRRKWITMRLPVAAPRLVALAEEWLRFLHPLTGKVAKAVAVDLDNTLWGGVLGEDGPHGIRLDGDYPGAAFVELQRALLDLHRRGILLAIVSKNDPQDALNAIASHPNMLLRREHFAAHRIGWANKSDSLREIAKELNIGTDALAFLDDNPVERQQVRMELPEVMVIDLPDDVLEYAQAVRDCPVFERLRLSDEDRQRNRYYVDQRSREALGASCSSPEEFLRSLDQAVEIAPANSRTMSRIAQLTQKTSQFNLTTRRYSEPEIAALAARDDTEVFSLRVTDVFNDNGVTGVAIVRYQAQRCDVDTFLLSCRVIGRTVETALLSCLCAQARKRGAERLQGWFLPTRKNAPAADFYPRHGFSVVEESPAGQCFALCLGTADVPWPDWIRAL